MAGEFNEVFSALVQGHPNLQTSPTAGCVYFVTNNQVATAQMQLPPAAALKGTWHRALGTSVPISCFPLPAAGAGCQQSLPNPLQTLSGASPFEEKHLEGIF